MRFETLLLVNPPYDGYYRAYLPTGLGYVAQALTRSGIGYGVIDLELEGALPGL